MTTTNLIEKRRKRIEQQKNRLKQLETSLNSQERKKRTRKLIEVGGLAAKANIEDWNANTLLGAFLTLKAQEQNKQQIDAWTHKGGTTFAKEKGKNLSSRKRGVPVIVKFETQPPEEIRASLKTLGLKWNALRKEWEEYARVEKLREILEPHKTLIQQLEKSVED